MVRNYVEFDGSETAFSQFLDLFQNESDRAAGVLGPAFLDELLKELLLAIVVDANLADTELLSSSRPLGSFAARIDAVYSFGLISARDRRDLHSIRKVRNQFAHFSRHI